jgi:hypothetical protein
METQSFGIINMSITRLTDWLTNEIFYDVRTKKENAGKEINYLSYKLTV